MAAGEGEHPPGPDGVGRHRQVGRDATDRCHDRGGVGVLVSVDPDDSVDPVCEHGHGRPPGNGW